MTEQSNSSFLRWGIVGLGRHARRFMTPAMHNSDCAKLMAVCSRDLEKAKVFAQEAGCDHAFDSLKIMLNSGCVDAVYVGTPNHIHKEQVLQIAKAGVHVLCDKPLAHTVNDCQVMVDSCRSSGVKLGVGFHLRHNPAHNIVCEKIRSGVLGELKLIDIQYMHVITESEAKGNLPAWRKSRELVGGGEFVGTGVHAIDILRHITGREIISVSAQADRSRNTSGFEQLIQTVIGLEDSLPVSLSAGGLKYPLNGLNIYGSDATLRCTGSLGYHGGGRIEISSKHGTEVEVVDQCDPYVFELDAFYKSVQQNTEPNASGNDGLKACEAIAAVYASLETCKRVTL